LIHELGGDGAGETDFLQANHSGRGEGGKIRFTEEVRDVGVEKDDVPRTKNRA